MLNQTLRYAPVLRVLRGTRPKRFLEVGSGCQGIGPYVDFPFVGVDIDFLDYGKARGSIHPGMAPVRADAARLPFRGGAFDTTISVDTLEHVPEEARESVLEEILRVTKGTAIIAFPCGTNALSLDADLDRYYKGRGLQPPAWLAEHLARGFPGKDWLESFLRARNLDFSIHGNENLTLHGIVSRMEAGGWSGFLLGALNYRIFVLGLRNRVTRPLVGRILAWCDRGEPYRRYAVIRKEGVPSR